MSSLCGPEVQQQIVDLLGREARLGSAFSDGREAGRVKFESQLRIEGPEVAISLGNVQARGTGGSLQALDSPARCTGLVHHLVQEVPTAGEGTQLRM